MVFFSTAFSLFGFVFCRFSLSSGGVLVLQFISFPQFWAACLDLDV
jgi:hypothetical protein